MTPYSTLSPEDIQHFIDKGYVVLKNCFSKEFAREWVEQGYKRLGYGPDDPSKWEKELIHMPTLNTVTIKEFAPKAWGAMVDLVGGEDRIKDPEKREWGDGFIVNFRRGADRPWEPPSAAASGWHVDGDFFVHFLDSGEQGLLTVVIWQDIQPQGGGTFIAPDSLKPVAQLLAEHPEGIHPFSDLWKSIPDQCTEFLECFGEAGDVVILHPLMLHASSNNVSRIPRFMTNPPLPLAGPLNLNRDNPDEFSPIELAILKALGVERYDFQPTAPRERVVPPRVAAQQKMAEEEKARLAASGQQ